ncbi:hypothetical protein U1Q18_039518 [Sarracenia purpurea var. burkii]
MFFAAIASDRGLLLWGDGGGLGVCSWEVVVGLAVALGVLFLEAVVGLGGLMGLQVVWVDSMLGLRGECVVNGSDASGYVASGFSLN